MFWTPVLGVMPAGTARIAMSQSVNMPKDFIIPHG
jgi:hypothetical protein